MADGPEAARKEVIRGARRGTVIAIIVSLSITAVIGIFTLLSGEFGDTQARILGTTLLIAAFSITTLCHLAVAGRALRIVGYVGIAVSIIALVAGIFLIWQTLDDFNLVNQVFKAFAAFSVLAMSFAHANLLLLLGERKRPVIRIGLFTTVGLIAIVALLLILPIVTDGAIPGDEAEAYARVVGIVAILDVLGTIVLPVMSRFLRDGGARGPETLELRLSPDLAARVESAAAARSISPEQVVIEAIERMPE
jgi:hypothetical protein